ncbi:hypothetical protein ODI_R3685 [Orrella dioscoreae]|uniref:Uncharacterized protein n=2 Tax=root TaxID=1 RepID=A0A1C3JY37_9BURK|nr:hypothetical protein ODI_03483 [Orrella dioscoreae]SOE51783.1 hypothetical protein ODI_R3685 [Orrella dioscoreae]
MALALAGGVLRGRLGCLRGLARLILLVTLGRRRRSQNQ